MKRIAIAVGIAVVAIAFALLFVHFESGPPSGVVEISKEHVQRELGDAEALAKAVTIAPHFEGERMVGFLMVEVHRGSVAHAIGLRAGDVVLRIGGIDLDAPERPFEVHAKLKDQRQTEVTMRRNGQLHTFVVRVDD
jgi:type II secretory pathway component PulC